MKRLTARFAPLMLLLVILVPPPSVQSLVAAPNQKQDGKANNNKKQTAAEKKKEAEQRKKAQERAEAERKRKAEEERKRKQAIETARKNRLQGRAEEAKSGVRKCAGEARELEGRYQKMLEGRNLIARSIKLLSLKPAKEESKAASARLLKIDEQFKSKAKDLQGAMLSIEGIKNSEKKTQYKGGTAETLEKTLLGLKRELSSVNATIKSGESYNKSYARYILALVPEFVRAGVKFSDKEKASIRKLSTL
jgi:hypothetical protein